jgi:autotransporter translocation and assembly factor TamB
MIVDKGKYSLRGPVNIVRGQYDLFGRRFTVIQGKIDYLGEETTSPPIFLEAEYIYRTVGREKRSLVIKITGSLEYPVITFLENNNQISQDDALSIVLYGRKKDELSFGTQSDMAEMDGSSAAMGIVSNMLSDRLTRSFSDDLKLDVIEVNATDKWQGANFVVGKYITPDIFVTYKREFGQSVDNNLYPETISMEYEIRKNLFLQLIQGNPQDSGYDLLFRFDWD